MGWVSYIELGNEFAVSFGFCGKLPIYSDLKASKYYNTLQPFFSVLSCPPFLPILASQMDLPGTTQSFWNQSLFMSTKCFLNHFFPQSRKTFREFGGNKVIWSGAGEGAAPSRAGEQGQVRKNWKGCGTLRTEAEHVHLHPHNLMLLLVMLCWAHTWPLPRSFCFW